MKIKNVCSLVALVFTLVLNSNIVQAQDVIIKKSTSERPKLLTEALKGQSTALQALINSSNKGTMELLNAYYEEHKTLPAQLKKSLFTDYNNALKTFIKFNKDAELENTLIVIVQKALAAAQTYLSGNDKFIIGFTKNAQTAATSYADITIEHLKNIKLAGVTEKIQNLEKLKKEMSQTSDLNKLQTLIQQIQTIKEEHQPYLPGQGGIN